MQMFLLSNSYLFHTAKIVFFENLFFNMQIKA